MTLSPRERRTLLTALQCWLNELSYHNLDELQHFYPDLGPNPLTLEEVAALIERVKRGAR